MAESGREILEAYLARMAEIRATGAATSETSYYSALENLLNVVGRQLRPRVIANGQIRNQGAGHPDFGLYSQAQLRGGEPVGGVGAIPERGVVEVKGLSEDNWLTADSTQVSQYWQHYGLVLVSNYRAFLLIGRDSLGQPVRLEGFSLADSDTSFWNLRTIPSDAFDQLGEALQDYLRRAISYLAPLTRPSDLAWLLASYARDALRRVEASTNLPALQTVRSGLEQALGLSFEGAKGEHFFRSTLVQTLFYGIFSAWVQWARAQPIPSSTRFDWHGAGWTLHVPMVRTLFEQIATPSRLGPLGLVEILDWTGQALNRVDRVAFFEAFDEGRAVQYFYEPFLAHFDPALRKQLGVWYTPPEIVHYMIRRVDLAVREELGIPLGLADPAVHILDPCCGTGSFLVEALRLIHERLREQQGEDALLAHDLTAAARERLFGFELMPAPFVVAHWQIGTMLAQAGAPLTADQRAGVYLTNSLTGWAESDGPVNELLWPELQPEHDAAERVKRVEPILVIIGNPPYNAFAGVSPEEEEGLVEPYKEGLRSSWNIRKYNLDELYTRFLRVAERRIVEGSGRGVLCYISSYSYLSDPSFVVVRQHLLSGFNYVWIDSLNGDSRETGKRTPEGGPDPSVFSTPFNREGIKLGTAVGMFVRNGPSTDLAEVRYRQFWGTRKREELVESLSSNTLDDGYEVSIPTSGNRYNFRPLAAGSSYDAWPDLMALAEAEPFSGLAEMRRGSLIATDPDELSDRMRRYMDPSVTFETLRAENTGPVDEAGAFDPERARERLLARESFDEGQIIRYAALPLDTRHAYYTTVSPIWNRSRPEFYAAARDGNRFLVSRMMAERPREGMPVLPVTALPDYHILRPNIRAFPFRLLESAAAQGDLLATGQRANLSVRARAWLSALSSRDPDTDVEWGDTPWYHALAMSTSPAWLAENQAAILGGWPRVPLPADLVHLQASASLGRQVAALLDTEQQVSGVTTGPFLAPLAAVGRLVRNGGGTLSLAELAVTGWGRGGRGEPVMPGAGNITQRAEYDEAEHEALENAAERLAEDSLALSDRLGPPIDVHLNDVASIRCVPAAVYELTIGGYQVLKKWLSYRDSEVIGRPITIAEAREAAAIVRRLTAYIIMQPALDASYEAIKASIYEWSSAADANDVEAPAI